MHVQTQNQLLRKTEVYKTEAPERASAASGLKLPSAWSDLEGTPFSEEAKGACRTPSRRSYEAY